MVIGNVMDFRFGDLSHDPAWELAWRRPSRSTVTPAHSGPPGDVVGAGPFDFQAVAIRKRLRRRVCSAPGTDEPDS